MSAPLIVDMLLGLASLGLVALMASFLLWPSENQPATTLTMQTDRQGQEAETKEGRFAMLATASPFLRTETPAAQTDNLPLTSLNIALLGIRLAETGDSSAILRTSGKTETAFIIGEEIVPGVRLAGIYMDHVVLSRGGRRERLFLDGTDARNLNR